jgi:adenylate cyclase
MLAGAMVVIAAVLVWRLYTPSAPQPEGTPKEKIVASRPEKVATPSAEVVSKEEGGPKLEVPSKDKMSFSLPDKPSIAVLPFVNMSKDPDQEHFSDGLTEEIINILSKSPYLFVVARTSMFVYKGKSVRVDQVAQELGVRYVLEGSVRRAGDRVRISAQLIDAKTGHNQWAERYEGNMRDVLAIQDEIASKIMKTLHAKLRVGPDPSETRGGSKNAEAYLKSVEGTEQILRFTRDGVLRAQKLFEEVIALEPDFSRGYSGLALSYGMNVYFGGSASPKESMAQAIDLAQKAISLNETDAINHAALAYLFAITRRHDTAVARAERALALDSNSFPVVDFSGIALMYSCKGKEAVAAFEKTERLNPSFPHSPLHLSWAYRLAGRYEEAFKQAQKAVDRTPQNLLAHLALTATCNLTGREAEARAAAETVLKINPNFSAERFRNDLYLLFKDKSQIDLTINALHKAGLK